MPKTTLKLLATLLVIITTGLYFLTESIKDDLLQKTRTTQRQLSNQKKLNQQKNLLQNAEDQTVLTAPPINASSLEAILTQLSQDHLFYKTSFRLTPQEPLIDGEITLQYAKLDISFYTFLDSNIFQFLEALKQQLEQPFHIESLQIKKRREPDYADYNLLENGQIVDILECRMRLVIYFVE